MSEGEKAPLVVNSGGGGSASWWRTHKKHLTIAVVAVVIVAAVVVPTVILVDSDSSGGSGISSCQGLQNMQLDGTYKLSRNIDCSDSVNWNGGAGFLPIGDYDDRFTGRFDGNGYTITGLYIYAPTRQFCGLFGAAEYAVIENVFLNDVEVICDDDTAGLLGRDIRVSKIKNNHVSGYIKGSNKVGGVIGYASGSAIEDCSANVIVEGNEGVGALVGDTYYVQNDLLLRSHSHGNVTGINKVGGLVGSCTHNVRYSFSDAMVSGKSYVGGLVGEQRGSYTLIRDCYAMGPVTCTQDNSFGTTSVGGFAGYSYMGIQNCYSTGLVSTINYEDQYITGFIGRAYSTARIERCYWDTETSGRESSWGGAGKVTEEMHTPSTYEDWDSNIWDLVQGEYPTLVEVPGTVSLKSSKA